MIDALRALHPANQVQADRHGRAFARANVLPAAALGTRIPICDHSLRLGECRTCIELRHAELGSVTVRAAYAFGDWPPAP